MQNYRLNIDFPLAADLEESKLLTALIVEHIARMQKFEGVEMFQYRLSHDSDRGNKNYLDINENGHCSNKKIKVEY
jgi:hypothetical protein